MNNKELVMVRYNLMNLLDQLSKQYFAEDNELLSEAVSKLMEVQSLLHKYERQS